MRSGAPFLPSQVVSLYNKNGKIYNKNEKKLLDFFGIESSVRKGLESIERMK